VHPSFPSATWLTLFLWRRVRYGLQSPAEQVRRPEYEDGPSSGLVAEAVEVEALFFFLSMGRASELTCTRIETDFPFFLLSEKKELFTSFMASSSALP